MPCLKDEKEELRAGQIAGRLLIAQTPQAYKAIAEQIPYEIEQRVWQIFGDYHRTQVDTAANFIAQLETRPERIEALDTVHWNLRAQVREKVEKIFQIRKQRNANGNTRESLC